MKKVDAHKKVCVESDSKQIVHCCSICAKLYSLFHNMVNMYEMTQLLCIEYDGIRFPIPCVVYAHGCLSVYVYHLLYFLFMCVLVACQRISHFLKILSILWVAQFCIFHILHIFNEMKQFFSKEFVDLVNHVS